jgi:hypothetical protein
VSVKECTKATVNYGGIKNISSKCSRKRRQQLVCDVVNKALLDCKEETRGSDIFIKEYFSNIKYIQNKKKYF